ncbi:DUF368 domain-containing protein [Parvibaculum sp.]|uniref:DUF368 domain-containing protein n=1 Tax=Parvibaculum sp. TaxID=2024848 RepID=UPI003918DF22
MEARHKGSDFPMATRWRVAPLLTWTAAALLLAASWIVPVAASLWSRLDTGLHAALNGTAANSLMATVWAIGCEPRFAAFLILTILASWLVHLGRERGPGFAHDLALGIVAALLPLILLGLNATLVAGGQPSPAAAVPDHIAIGTAVPWSEAGTEAIASFPASHAVFAGGLTVMLWLGFGRNFGLMALALLLLTALPRVAAGAEWASGSIAGGLGGAFVALALATGTPLPHALYRIAHIPSRALVRQWERIVAALSNEDRENFHPAKQVLRGMCIGAADLVPGVSGGTMALILGIYKRLIGAIAHFDAALLGHLRRIEIAAALRRIDILFLVPIGIGVLLALIIFSRVIPLSLLVTEFPEAMFGFFFGLIAASIAGLLSHVEIGGAKGLIWLALGTAFGLAAATLVPVQTPDASWFIFLAGMAAIAAMLVPGISGSFVLLILGKYTDAIDALGRLDFSFLLPLLGGVVTGALVFSRAISWLLDRFYRRTMLTVTGILAGSLLAVWPFKDRQYETIGGKERMVSADPYFPLDLDLTVAGGIAAILAGILLYRLLDRLAQHSDG